MLLFTIHRNNDIASMNYAIRESLKVQWCNDYGLTRAFGQYTSAYTQSYPSINTQLSIISHNAAYVHRRGVAISAGNWMLWPTLRTIMVRSNIERLSTAASLEMKYFCHFVSEFSAASAKYSVVTLNCVVIHHIYMSKKNTLLNFYQMRIPLCSVSPKYSVAVAPRSSVNR